MPPSDLDRVILLQTERDLERLTERLDSLEELGDEVTNGQIVNLQEELAALAARVARLERDIPKLSETLRQAIRLLREALSGALN